MKHRINPLVDFVFKLLFGVEENKNLLIHFLNAVLALPSEQAIDEVAILNPYNEKEFVEDKLSIVDVKAQDRQGKIFQVEVQLTIFEHLPARMLYTWSDIYQAQLGSGGDYFQLTPVTSIWLLEGSMLDSPNHYHCFRTYDVDNQIELSDHFSIHVLELSKWQKASQDMQPEDQWLYFFKEAQNWETLPPELNHPEMRQAMSVLERIAEQDQAYYRYQSRMDYLRQQKTIEVELEEKNQLVEEQRQEIQRLKKLLEKQGVKPDTE